MKKQIVSVAGVYNAILNGEVLGITETGFCGYTSLLKMEGGRVIYIFFSHQPEWSKREILSAKEFRELAQKWVNNSNHWRE